MTSARNRPQPSSGSKFYLLLALLLFSLQKSPAQQSDSSRQNQPAECKVALLLPFQSDNVYELQNRKIHFTDESQLSVEYFQGAELAFDSLNKAGQNCKLLVFDAGKDSVQLNGVLRQVEVQECNAIVAPVNNAAIEVVNRFAKAHHILCFSPYSTTSFPTDPNDRFFIANASLKTHWERTIDFIRQQFSLKNIFIVYQGDEHETISSIRDYISKRYGGEKPVGVVALGDTGKLSFKNFDVWRNKDSLNEVLILSGNESFVRSVCRTIYQSDSTANIFGMPGWLNFLVPENDFSHLNVFISSPYFINDSLKSYKQFESVYQKRFQQAGTLHSLNGFDQLLCIDQLWRRLPDQKEDRPEFKSAGIIHRFSFQPVTGEDGAILYYENSANYILKFTGGFFTMYE